MATRTYYYKGRKITMTDGERLAMMQDIADNGYYARKGYDGHKYNEEKIQKKAAEYDMAISRLEADKKQEEEREKRKRIGVSMAQTAINTGIDRYMDATRPTFVQPTVNNGSTNAYAQALRRTTLEREKARLNSLPGTNLQEAADYEERMAAIDLALGKVQGNLNDLDRAGRVNREISNAKANADFAEKAKQGAQMSQGASAQWRLVNNPQGMRDETLRQASMVGDRQALRTYAGQEAYDHMTSEERDVFNYIYATQGSDAANAYLEDLNESLSTRRAQAEVKESQKLAKEQPLGANLMSVVGTLEGGLAYGEAALGRMLGQEIDLNDPLYDVARMRSTVRETTGVNIAKSVTDKTNSKFLGEAATFGYQTAMSMADSLMAAGLSAIGGSAVGATTLAGSAANDTMMQAKERGASDDQALVLGGLAGVAEALFEKIPLDEFLKEASPAARGAVVRNILRQAGIEAGEEGATEVANIITDALVMGDQSQYANMSAGKLAGQVALAALGGALSGAPMGALASGYSSARATGIGKNLQKQGVAGKVVQDALGSSDIAVSSLARDVRDGRAKMGARNVGRLYAGMQQADEQMQSTGDALRDAAMQRAVEQEKSAQPTQTAQKAVQAVSDEPKADIATHEKTAPAAAQQRRDAAVSDITGESITIEGIDSVEDGTVYVVAGEEKIPAADVQFADPQTAALYNAASEFDTATAQRFVAGYEGGDVQQYIQSFTSVYKDGQAGIPYETTLNQRISAQNLTENQRIDAYAGGVASNRPTVNAAKLKPGLTRSYTKASLSREAATALKKHRRQIEAIDVMAKKYGRKVVLVSSLEGMTIGGETITSAVNGAYDRSTDTIYIAADAQDGAFAYVAMHEMVHSIRKDSADNFNRLRDTVFEALEAAGEDVDTLIDYQINSVYKGKIDRDGAIEEVIANTAPTVLTDEAFVRNLYANDRSLFDKIKAFIDDLKEVFAQLTQSGSWAQDAALNEESVRKIAEMFDEVARGDLSANTMTLKDEFGDTYTRFSIRDEDPPRKTIRGYKVFVVFENKPGELYPPMVANPGGESTPVGVWLNADAAPRAADSKTGRMQVQAGGKGTQASKQQLAYRPGWHLGDLPMATQFARLNPETGKKELFPANFVWAECDCAADLDYQEEAMSYGYNKNGKFQHSLAGLPRLPREADGTAGYYRYRTNPRPDTVPWIITGAMKVHRILDDAETDAILREAGVEPMARQGGPIDLEKYGFKKGEIKYSAKDRPDWYDNVDKRLYNKRMWTRVAEKEVLTSREYKSFEEKLSDIKNGDWFPRTVDGDYIVHAGHEFGVNNRLIVTDGVHKNATIYRVYAIDKYTETEIEGTRDEIYKIEAWAGRESVELIRDGFVNEYVTVHCPEDYPYDRSKVATSRRRAGGARGEDGEDSGEALRRGRSYLRDREDDGDLKYSAKDSTGRTLSDGQQKFFADSKVRDENGNLMVMYHGTPYGGFTEFRSASYFTANKAYADIYHNPSASSLRGRYNPASNEMTYEVYLNITKPFDTRKAKERRIFQNEYYRKWGNGTPLSESGLPDWTDGMDLQEFIEEMEYDYDGLILDEGGYPGENGEVVSRGLSYVVFNASQVKNVDNTNPTEDPDIRFSMRDTTPANTRRLERENTKLKAALTNARAQLKLTSGHEVSRPAVERLARKIIRTTQSKVDASKLANDLMQIYSYAATSGNSDTALREIDSIGIGVAKKIIQQAESVDTVSAEQFADLKEYLRTTGITLNESQRADAAAMYGSYGDFRKEYFGKIKLVKDGVPLDVAWGELNHRYPWLFNAEGDNMLEALVHAADLTQPQLVNPYAEDIDGAAADLWLTIQNEYVNLPEVRTFADKQKEKMDKLRAEQRQLVADMRREARRRMEDTRTAERMAEGRKQAAAQQKADARMETQQERADARIAALEARIRELEQQVKDERAAGQINAAVERKAGRQAVEEARTAERMAEGRIRSEERQRAAERLEAQKQRDAEKLREVREQRDQKRVQDLREQRETINAQRKERDEQTKYRERIMANAKTLTAWLTRPTDEKHVPESMRKVIAKFLETLEWGDGTKRTQKGDLWRSRLMEMLLVMERIDKAADEGQALDIDPDLTARMEKFLGGVPDTVTSIGNLNTEQLRDLDYILQTVKRTVVYANRTRANKLYASVSAVGDATITEMDLSKGKSKFWQTFSAADKFFNIQQLDSFSFFAGLGEAAESILYELRDGFDEKIKHVQQAVEYVKPFTDGLKMREISGKQAKLHTFQLNTGEVKMTTAQIMELYELLKREQARGHIFGSGIRIADISRGKLAAEVKQIDPVQITVEEALTIVDSLTDQQKQLADRLAWFMGNECAAWGNETSVLMYGYKKFTEQNYYPIHSDSNFILTSDKNDKGQQGAFAALKNLGMTKQVQKGAHNPIIVGDIFDTFTQHVDDMASYNGMMPALSDAMKWYNFKAESETGKVKSVKRSMERRAGVHAKGYFETLIKQLNGVNDRGERIGITNWLTSHAKAAAVGANLRVVLQQPSAYVRAAAVIDPKYLLKGFGVPSKANRADAKQYSPIARWKSWGFYDISVGKDMRSLLFNDSNFDEKLREWSMAPAGGADAVTWGALFRACLAEQKDIHPDWSEDQQKTAAGRRLSEIVDLTQVVDSPFHKSQLMRSSDGLVRMQTAFMAEPTKTYNLLRTSLVKAIEKKDKASIKQFGRTAVTWLVSAATTAAFAAIADVGRDDDDDQTVLEKYGEALSANLIDNVNLLNSIPFVKDILSLLEGYEPSRLDMQAADKLINLGKVWLKQLNAEKGEKPYTHWYMAYQTAQAVSSITGIPVGNLMREVDAIASTFGADLKTKTSVASAAERYAKLYGAIVEGKDAKVKRIEAALREDEKSHKDIDSGVAKVLAAQDDRIAEAYEARERGDIATLDEIRDELAELFGEEVVDKALNLYENGAEKEPSEKNLNETLSAPLFDYADMEVVALQAFETGDTDALERVIAEIKADSDAQNPDQAVRTKATTLFKPVYLKAKSRGYTKQAARIKKILIEVFGMKAETIDKWKEK